MIFARGSLKADFPLRGVPRSNGEEIMKQLSIIALAIAVIGCGGSVAGPSSTTGRTGSIPRDFEWTGVTVSIDGAPSMLVTPDAHSALNGTFAAGTTAPKAFTVGSGANRLLIVTVHLYSLSNIGGVGSTGVTYNGVALTFNRGNSNALHCKTETWILVNPPSGTHNVVVSYTGTPDELGVEAASFSGVDQVNPVNTNSIGGAALANPATITPLPVIGALYAYGTETVIYATGSGVGPPSAPTVLTTVSVNTNLVTSGNLPDTDHFMISSFGAYSGASSTITWTANNSGVNYDWTGVSISLNGAPDMIFPSSRFGVDDPMWKTEMPG